uniref:beta-N-acetylhexosaminidase n=1 Tax=Hippocampus comes TaxID=109280 RepID=A0A3Q2YBM4_HIPCM
MMQFTLISLLREVSNCVGTLNPHKEEGFKLVMEMLRQVVELHPGLNALHIGADEVYMLGEGELSKLWLASSGRTVEQLFLSHVASIVKYIKKEWPHMTIIMWDDMMRGMSQDTLKASGIVGFVQPMLWDYTPNLDVDKTGMNCNLAILYLNNIAIVTIFSPSEHDILSQ